MGKFTKKIGKTSNDKKKDPLIDNEEYALELKREMDKYMEEGKYREAVVTLADLVQKTNTYDPYYAYQGARALFYMGDYNRAAVWCKNAIDVAPNVVTYHILSFKVDLKRDMVDQVLKRCEALIIDLKEIMSLEEMKEILELVRPYAVNNPADFMQKFPQTANLFRDVANMNKMPNNAVEKAHNLLSKLRKNLKIED